MIVARIKELAAGKWSEVLLIPSMRCDTTNGQPCPKCGGDDRFHVDADFEQNGTVYCRRCSPKGTGDGIGTYAWFHELTNKEAIHQLAKQLHITTTEQNGAPKRNLIEAICNEKRMPIDAFLQFKPAIAKRGKFNVVRVPVWNAKGESNPAFDLWPGTTGKFKAGSAQGLFLPGRLPMPSESWLIVEGVKDAAALIGIGFRNACGLPTNQMNPLFAALFRECDVIIVPDCDQAGKSGSELTASRLFGIASRVRVARLPGEFRDKGGDDVRDIIARRGPEEVKKAIALAKDWSPAESEPEKTEKPRVTLSLNEGRVADDVVEHLGRLGWSSDWIPLRARENSKVYTRGGLLVHVVPSEDPGTVGRLTIKELPEALIRERVSQACELVTIAEDKEGNVVVRPERPPKWLVDSISERHFYSGKIRSLVGIVQTPTLRADGTILQKPGYDEQSGLIFKPNADYPEINENPTQSDAADSWSRLHEAVSDFPFVSEHDKAAWLAMLLSMVGRPCIDGCVPLFGITATTAASGKGLLCDVTTTIAYGHQVSKKGFPLRQEELAKQITSILLEGSQCHVFDNVDITLRGAELDAMLTASVWKDRLLGFSKTTGELPQRCVWVATGNNLQFGTDTARRVLPIRLEPQIESPEERSDFKFKPLLSWILQNRPSLVVDAITILRAFFVAGCPRLDDVAWGSFESWTAIVRGAVLFAGVADPMQTRQTVTEQDETKELLRRVIAALEQADPDGRGNTVREMQDLVRKFPDQFPLLSDLTAELCEGSFSPKRFAKRLTLFRGRITDGKRIQSVNCGRGVKKWRVLGCTETSKNSVQPPVQPSVQPYSANENTGNLSQGWTEGTESLTSRIEKQKVSLHGYPARPRIEGLKSVQPVQPQQPYWLLDAVPAGQTLIDCPACQAKMIPAQFAVQGWRNHDCPSCGHVVPRKECLA